MLKPGSIAMASDTDILMPGGAKVWNIPPGEDFLRCFAEALVRRLDLENRPDAAADALIYVPNQRSAKALAKALYQAAGERPIVQPEIRALGDLETDEAPPSAEAALIDLPEAISPGKRIGALAAMVRTFYLQLYGIQLPAVSALAAAGELIRLLDQAALSGDQVDWSKLPELAEGAELAQHWEASASFLSIVSQHWPGWLEENEAMDPFARRLASAEALAEQWRQSPPQSPVMIIGSTGATPASRVLMKAATGLPHGLVVLPGLIEGASLEEWSAIRASVSHPQSALAQTLATLEIAPDDVPLWPRAPGHARGPARRKLIYEALAPADATADWLDTLDRLSQTMGTSVEGFAEEALQGLGLIEAPDEASEALAAALLMRETLEIEGHTAAFITPDAGLARRVAAQLKRWGIDVPPSSGEPLIRTDAGSMICLCAEWSLDPADPVRLASVLKHPFVRMRDGADVLERNFLRGPRRWSDLKSLAELIQRAPEDDPYRPRSCSQEDSRQAGALVETLHDMIEAADADLTDVAVPNGAELARRIADLAGRVSETPLPWAGETGQGAAQLFEFLDEVSSSLGPVTSHEFVGILIHQATQMTVSGRGEEHPRLAIWGPLEARLQSADRLILGGLNEDVWPQRPAVDGFLPRRFRDELGLADPEDRIGLSAHDFAQLACAPDVILMNAARRDDAPAVASRWVWRLQTLANGALGEAAAKALSHDGGDVLAWVKALRGEGLGSLPAEYSSEPRPKRAPEHWPKRLSVTRVDLLQRDPYALWAENALRLDVLEALGAELGPGGRGTAIHRAIELFEAPGATKSAEALVSLLGAELIAAGETEEAWIAKQAVWHDLAEWYLHWRADRAPGKREIRGELELTISGAPFILSAVADRLEVHPHGAVTIVDFKTGNPPSDKEIAAGLSQQMPLQALIARKGGFIKEQSVDVESLEYVAFKANPSTRVIGGRQGLSADPAEMAESALEGVIRLVSAYRCGDGEILSAPRVKFVKYDNGYNRLARRAEWASDTEEGDGGDG